MKKSFDIYKFEDQLFAIRFDNMTFTIEGICLTDKPYILFQVRYCTSAYSSCYTTDWIFEYYKKFHDRRETDSVLKEKVILIAEDKEIEYEEKV